MSLGIVVTSRLFSMISRACLLTTVFGVVLAGAAYCKEPSVSRVVKLTFLAVVLPEQAVRKAWDCESWTPTLAQVADAEKAMIKHLSPTQDASAPPNLKERYIIQYYGIVVDKKKWIVCGVYKTRALLDLAREVEHAKSDKEARWLKAEFDEQIETLLTYPYSETDSTDWFDAFFDPATNKLSRALPGTGRNVECQ
jgi:hypothetical protein